MSKMPSRKKKAFRYDFDPSKIKYKCYDCNEPNKYSRYIDTYTGKLLPEKYGKCDRENNCGYSRNPYTDAYVRSQKDSSKESELLSNDRVLAPTKKLGTIPFKYLIDSLGSYDDNQFVQYLNRLLGVEKTKELAQRFFIGSSDFWWGSTVFWLVDEDMNVRGGQVILYGKDGKTLKEDLVGGKKKRYNSWFHTSIEEYHKDNDFYIPQWIIDYKECEKFPFPFGLHQLGGEPDKPVAIVESAKTAIIATAYYPKYIWLAIGSLRYLNSRRLSYLIGRKITLFPDQGGYFLWSEKADKLSHLNIIVSDFLELHGEQGSDLADYLVQLDWRDVQGLKE